MKNALQILSIVAVAGVASAFVPSHADAGIGDLKTLPEGLVKPPCPIPTLAQCQDPVYLETDRCGQLQRTHKWTCAELMQSGMEKKKGEARTSVVPKKFDEGGVAETVPSPPDAQNAPEYKADTFSYASQAAAAGFTGPSNIQTNQFETWNGNGVKVESCQEYVHEKFYDVTEFVRSISFTRGDAESIYAVAFGPSTKSSSIGSRHLGNAQVRGKDGRPFGTLLGPTSKIKNLFVGIVPVKKGYIDDTAVPGPDIVEALQRTDRGQALYAKAVYGREVVNQDMLWHKTTHDKIIFVPGQTQKTLALGPLPTDPDEKLAKTLGTTGGTKPIRKRLPAELDELYTLGQRFLHLQRDWVRLNIAYAGSGWTNDELGKPMGPTQFSGVKTPVNPQGTLATTNGGTVPVPIVQPSETVLRKRIVLEMLDLLERADDEGCLEKGLTACDWSPKLFASITANDFSDEQDRAFSQCNSFTGGNFQQVKNLNVKFVDDPDPKYDEFRCIVKTGATITAQQFDTLQEDVKICREKAVAYKKQKAEDLARQRVKSIPELVDQGTGNFKKPGIAKSRDELMGNKYFGLGYNYDLGWLVEPKADICKMQIDTHASFLAYANVFAKQRNLVDAAARFDTEAKNFHLHFKVAGKNIFTPVDKGWSTPSPLEYKLSKDFGTGKKSATLVKTYIVVVIVPIKIEAGISGEVGINLGFTANAQGFDNESCPKASVGGLIEPYVAVNGYVEAGIDVLIASAGIRGELTIIRASTPFTTGVGVALLSGTLAPENLELQVNTKLGVKLQTLSGSVRGYAQVGWCPFCIRGEKEIVSWEGPSLDTTLFQQQYKVNLADLGIAFADL